jgi:hypothetical protein
MTFSEIVSSYYINPEVVAFFKKVANEWWEELRQDVFLIICEYDEQKIIDMHNKKALKFFIVRIALNQYRSKNSKFYYQNIKNNNLGIALANEDMIESADAILYSNVIYDTQDEPEWEIKEKRMVRVEDSLENLRFFEREILKLYLQLGTYKNVAKDTGIPIRTIANAVKNSIANIKLEINE